MESTVHDVLQKDRINLKQHDLQKDVSKICKIKLQHATKQKFPKSSITPLDQAAIDEYDQKDILFKMMRESMSYDKNPAHKASYDALVQLLLVDEDDMDRGVVKPSTQKKRHHDDNAQDPPPDSKNEKKKRRRKDAEPSKKSSTSKDSSKGKTPPKTSKMDKSMTAEESVKEPVHEVAIDVVEHILDDVVNDAHQPQDYVDPMKDNSSWFKQPPRPKTPDPEWNKDPNIDDGPEQTWLNDRESCKGLSRIIIELEYHLEQRYLAFSDQMDWTNPEGDRCSYDLSKPLPFQGPPEIMVRRVDQKEYTFKEGYFPRLHLNDIEDMLLLHVPNKLFNLPGNEIIDLPLICQNQRDLPRDIPIVRLEVLRYNIKRSKVRMGIMPTKTELALEQSQQSVSNEVLNIRVIPHNIHSDDGNPSSANIKQALCVQDESFQGRLFNRFQDEGKYEHVGLKVTRSQEGKESQRCSSDDARFMIS
ncbi:hypothetical protein Tco_0569651 [Tanacetum coccineum]